MAVYQTLSIQVGEMTTVITPGDPITPVGVGVMMIDCHDMGHILKECDAIAEGTLDFLLTSQKMKALIVIRVMALPTKLPMKMKSHNKFAS